MIATREACTAIQSYFRENARSQYESLAIPPFTIFFHPSSNFPNFTFAIPDDPVEGDLSEILLRVKARFAERGRVPRFEFLEAFAPFLPSALEAAGFSQVEYQWTMVCTPETLQPVEEVEGLSVISLHADSGSRDIREFITVQQVGFNPSGQPIADETAIRLARAEFLTAGWQPYLSRWNGEPAACAVAARIIEGVTELTGIATLPEFRRRGIAAYLTYHATAQAFQRGAKLACLTAANEPAGRVYERSGYQAFAIMLTFEASAEVT